MVKVLDVVLLNWNGSDATYNAFRNVLASSILPSKIIIVDNFSSDCDYKNLLGLFEHINFVAERTTEYDHLLMSENVVIVRNRFNSGYADGNNLGIMLAKKLNDPDFFWILNNDAEPVENALEELLLKADENQDALVSSVTLSSNGLIEAYGGGTYYPILGKSKLLHKNEIYKSDLPVSVNYLMGASLLVPREVIERVGYMDECFFMYSEEVDWQWRAMKKGFDIQVAPKSIVYHAGSSSSSTWKYHYYRNRAAIMFNAIYYGCIFSIVSALVLSLITLVKNFRHPKSVIWGLKGCLDGLCKSRATRMGPI